MSKKRKAKTAFKKAARKAAPAKKAVKTAYAPPLQLTAASPGKR